MRKDVVTLLSGSSMTGTTTVSSNPILLDKTFGFAIQAVWTGTPNGTLKLQGSCDPVARDLNTSSGGPYTVTNWTDIANTSTSIAGSAGNALFNLDAQYYMFVRITYTNASSTGSLSAKFSGLSA